MTQKKQTVKSVIELSLNQIILNRRELFFLTWKTNSTFSIATPMNLADTTNTPTSSADLISNMTFLNLMDK